MTLQPRVVFAGTATAASVAFGLTARASATARAERMDRRIGPRLMLRKGRGLRRTAEATSPLGKWYSQIAISLAIAGLIARRRSPTSGAGALTIVAAGLCTAAACKAFDQVMPQPSRPPGRRKDKRKSVFPSGHTMAPLAVSVTAAWVAHREGIVDGRLTIPLALLSPVVTVSGKLMERKHWMSDVVGGYAAGVAIACGLLAVYEGTARRTISI